jgi:hypothetical protein
METNLRHHQQVMRDLVIERKVTTFFINIVPADWGRSADAFISFRTYRPAFSGIPPGTVAGGRTLRQGR